MHRGITIVLAAIALAAASVSPALAETGDYGVGQPDDDTYLGTRTAAQAAFEEVKLNLVAQVEALPVSTTAISLSSGTVSSTSACETACEYGTGGGDPTITETTVTSGSASTWGTTGFITPRNHMVLAVRARHQSTIYWCGPASGQVVINYSRGYVYDSLNGDSTVTNWKTQATIATWMKTTQTQGTLGSNLAAALNRTDAVKKPIPEWSYVYARNSDAQDLHSKVVTDVSQFLMPLVIAVMPHKTDAAYWLPSWPRSAGNAKHWIVLYGFDGLWDGTQSAQVYYTESAGNGAKNPGAYVVDTYTMWKVNQYNASTIVW